MTNNYKPAHVEVIDLPKDRLMVRPLSRLRLGARLAYEAAVLGAAPVIDGTVPRDVYSYRWWKRKDRILAPVGSWLRMQRAARSHHKRNSDLMLARTDISSFYESVDVETLLSELASLPLDAWTIEVISESLRSFNNLGSVWGLPQGYDVSGILANMYLLPIDALITSRQIRYFRYSDDIYAFGDDWLALRQILLEVNSALRSRRLILSSSKTRIIDSHSVPQELEDLEKDAISYGIRIRDATAPTDLRAYFDRVVADGLPDTRDLKYCLNQFGRIRDDYAVKWLLVNMTQLPHVARESLFYLAKFQSKMPEIGEEVVDLLTNSMLSLYPYAEQHLLIYLLRQNVYTKKSRQAAWNMLADKNKETFVREFAARYIGHAGVQSDGPRLRQRFQDEDNTRIRRALLVACYEARGCPPSLLRSVQIADQNLDHTAAYLLKAPDRIPLPQVKWEP
ncbi:RNA-directed DNA polymerase [Actinoplanes bogorensis]|uniref:RNA-directed DNA polymerase n=1 Tax=Paractinoplanes bogorensis TaxID=1610840 RepID=A0ABS5YUF5_9ACTN|nr:RNA-directed DNA polymerase [Actinoplanes bogorensis]MBU2667090.1 RNA-directed DNA polymerase [Actinoplanes bogorensis]